MKTEQTTCLIRSIIAAFITLASTGLGLIGGFLAEILYSPEGPKRRQLIINGTSAGLAAGAISAASAHVALMAAYEPNLLALGIGLLCGLGAGAILGLIASLLFAATIKKTTPQTILESQNDQ